VAEPRRRPLWRTLALAAQALALAAFFVAVEHYWGWSRLFQPWREVAPSALSVVVIILLLSYAIRALRIYWAEPEVPAGAYGTCLRLILLNNALNLLLPMRSGEASFPLLLRRWFGIGGARATGILLWLRLLDLQVLASLAITLAFGLGGVWLSAPLRAGGWVLAGAAIAAPLVVFLARGALSRWAARLRHGALLQRLLDGLPSHWGGVARDMALTFASWSIKLAGLGWILHRLAAIDWSDGALGVIGGDLSTVLPIHAPGGFGTYEAGVLAALSAGGPASRQALAGAVNLHLLILTTALLAGLLAWIVPGRRMVDSPAIRSDDTA
jgi:uncharacterized membrane protein YbhN (UPF0104 family)